MRKIVLCLLTVLLPNWAGAQYFSYLHDGDSTGDVAGDIDIQPDGTLFVFGGSYIKTGQFLGAAWGFTEDGTTKLTQKYFGYDAFSAASPVTYGQLKRLTHGGYINNITFIGATNDSAGLVRLTAAGDTAFLKRYDVPNGLDYEQGLTSAQMSDGGFLIGGRTFSAASGFNDGECLLIRTDSLGSLRWRRTYKKYGGFGVVKSLTQLPDGNILMGACYRTYVNVPPTVDYVRDRPWFVILDSAGNILRDTFFSTGYIGGEIHPDVNGGYYAWGVVDTVLSPFYPLINLPTFVAHLDDSFRVTWRTVRPNTFNTPYPANVIQSSSGGYLLAGQITDTNHRDYIAGWAMKLDCQGTRLWEREYTPDKEGYEYFSAVAEQPDGSLVFVGTAQDTSLPAWRQFDIWLLGTDSNGCPVAGCPPPTVTAAICERPTSIVNTPLQKPAGFALFPNPSAGTFTLSCPVPAQATVYDAAGRARLSLSLQAGTMALSLPPSAPPGIYAVRIQPTAGNLPPQTLRLLLQP